MKRQKQIFAIILALVFVISFTACGSQTTSKDQGTSKGSGASGQKVKISVYGVPNDWRDAGTALEKAFMDKYPNIEIEDIAYVSDSITFIKTKAATNDLPDITEMNNDDVGISLAKSGKLMDLKDLEAMKHIYDKIKKDYTLPDGMVYGVTQGFSTSFIYYNKDIFKQAGITTNPDNFEDFIAACDKIKALGITPIAIPAQDPVSSGFPFDYLAANTIGEKLGLGAYEKSLRDGTLDLTTSEGVSIFTKIQTLSKYFQEGATSATETNAHDLFAQKKAAMVFAGSWTAALAEKSGNDVGVMFPPFNEKGKEPWIETSSESGIAASTTHDSPEVNAAKKQFLEFWFSPEGYKLEQNARGNIPSIDNAIDIKLLPGVKDLLPTLSSSKSFTMNYAVYSSQAFEVFTSGMQELLIGATSPEDMARKLTDAVKKYPKKT